MRNLNRGIAAAALSAPLLLGMTGVATADEFEQSASTVGPEGVSTSQTSASADANRDGQVSFEQSQATAGPNGASSSSTEASAGDYNHDGLLDGLLGGSDYNNDHNNDGLLGGLLG